jgi:hypothetical protein
MLKNERGWFLQSYELRPILGLGAHLPSEGFEPVEVQGTMFKCEPAMAPRYHNGRRVKVSKHRLFYLCTDCRRWIPFGRASQHRKGAKHKGMAMYNAIGMGGRIGQ